MIASVARRDPRTFVRGAVVGQRKFAQLWTTIGLFLLVYLFGFISFPAMGDSQAFFNLFNTYSFLLICAVGEALVIISGGIDLSVSGIVALTTTATAGLLGAGWNPWLVIALMLVMGLTMGFTMGVFITYLKVQPFIATLAGMWFARGSCYLISDQEIRIHNGMWDRIQGTKIFIPGLSDPTAHTGAFVTVLAFVAIMVLIVGLYIAHLTRFGRTVYSLGGSNGANEISARLMGLSVNRTKVGVYVLSGFCSALAGLLYSAYVGSGHGTHATGFELTVIAATVIGGVSLTGGEGYLIGALVGVLITGLIQTLIQANGQLSSWWTSIVIGALMLFFIGVQSLLASLSGGRTRRHLSPMALARWRPRNARFFAAATAITVLAVGGLLFGASTVLNPPATAHCDKKPVQHQKVDDLAKSGAVVAYEKNGGTACVEEIYAVYADGKTTADANGKSASKQVTPDQVNAMLTRADSLGWFTVNMYSTSPDPCDSCYSYYIAITYKGQTKAVNAVDGNTIAPSNYWQVVPEIALLLPAPPTQ